MAGKQESSLKLCPAEREGINGEHECSLKLLPTESLSMEAVTGEEECSLKMCPTKRKAPTAGHLPPLKEGAIKRKGDDYCSVGVDTCANAILVAVTMDETEEQAISDTKVAAETQKGAPGTGFPELGNYVDAKVESGKTMDEEEKAFPETKGTVPRYWSDGDEEAGDDDDDDCYTNLSDAEYQLVVDKVNAKYNRFIERLRARTKSLVFKDVTAADFVDPDEGEVCA